MLAVNGAGHPVDLGCRITGFNLANSKCHKGNELSHNGPCCLCGSFFLFCNDAIKYISNIIQHFWDVIFCIGDCYGLKTVVKFCHQKWKWNVYMTTHFHHLASSYQLSPVMLDCRWCRGMPGHGRGTIPKSPSWYYYNSGCQELVMPIYRSSKLWIFCFCVLLHCVIGFNWLYYVLSVYYVVLPSGVIKNE